jgi:uncharacterized protein
MHAIQASLGALYTAPVADNDDVPMPTALPNAALPSLTEIEDAIRDSALGVGACELHGALCGWLAGGGTTERWLPRVLADDDLPAPAPGGALDRLCEASLAQLEDRDFGFDLLVPDADAPLIERSSGLFDWCRGFLGGFGLAAGQHPPLSEEALEALGDLAKLAAAVPQEDGDEEDEAALVEIEEFVRVAALLLHGDCTLGPRHRKQLH